MTVVPIEEDVTDKSKQRNMPSEVDGISPSTDYGSSGGDTNGIGNGMAVFDNRRHRYPFCIVWTPIPFLTWLFPFIGHMGIAYSTGVIRDFAGPYFVSEDSMAFGWPTRYWVLDPLLAQGGVTGWDRAVYEASEVYKTRVHNLICDNCHSHVAYALNLMNYKSSSTWNMVWLAWFMLIYGRFVDCGGFFKTWLPFLIIVAAIVSLSVFRPI